MSLRRSAEISPWLVGALGLALYASRACPTVCAFGDSAELGTAAVVWGVPHPPGYPLLTSVGHAFAALPFGAPAWRLHLTSALFHALTLVVVMRLLLRLTGSWIAAAIATLLLGLSRTFLLGSLYYEAFPLNDLLVAASLDLAERCGAGGESPSVQRRRLLGLALLLGVAAGHHQMISLALPGVVILAWPARRGLAARGTWAIALGLMLGAAGAAVLLLWVVARGSPEISWGNIGDASSLWQHLTRQEYGGLFSASRHPSPWWPLRRQVALLTLLGASAGAPALAVALAAAGWSVWRRAAPGIAFGLTFLLSGPVFFAINRVGLSSEEQLAWIERFASMSHVPLALLVGLGVGEIERLTACRSPRWHPAVVVGAALVVLPPALRAGRHDLSDDRLGEAFAVDLIERTPPGAVLLLRGDLPRTLAEHACVVDRRCGDRVLLPAHRAWPHEQARRRHPELGLPAWQASFGPGGLDEIIDVILARRPVLITPELLVLNPALARRYRIEPDLLLLRVFPRSAATREPIMQAAATAAGDGCAAYRELPDDPPRPTMHAQLLRMYEAGFDNLARRSRQLGASPELTRELAQRSAAARLPEWSSPAVPGIEPERVIVDR